MEIFLEEIKTDLNAFDIYSVFKDEKNTILLDSSTEGKLSEFSYIGVNPFLIFKGCGDNIEINDQQLKGDAVSELRALMKKYRFENQFGLPFVGGAIGYFSYDYGVGLENITVGREDGLVIPDYYFVFYDNLIIFDHKESKVYISACGILRDGHISISSIEHRISKQKTIQYPEVSKSKAEFKSNFTKEEYINTVEKVRQYIRSGDIYIANLTQRFQADTEKDGWSIYRDLRGINPAPFSCFMDFDGFEIISSSPERFLKIQNGVVETRPIKGTRPRGRTEEEDAENRKQLLESSKDKAELLMIVDLERNDLSRVCKPHSVKVTELFKLEEYSSVFHLVATVKGELKEEYDALDCFKACFPGGSITGTPKIRAMEIISELEKIKRSLYTGAIGYLSFDGNADFSIVIRTIIKQGNKCYFGVGGGVTWDSVCEDEYQETLDKAKALMRVI